MNYEYDERCKRLRRDFDAFELRIIWRTSNRNSKKNMTKHVRDRGGNTMLLHDCQELDDDLGGGLDEHLTFTALFCVEHILQGIVHYTDSHHRGLPVPHDQIRIQSTHSFSPLNKTPAQM